jgi:pyruvate/2-oxoglutarate dehydrogenase complex dihydrolipoamide acyltransferase (E2) component
MTTVRRALVGFLVLLMAMASPAAANQQRPDVKDLAATVAAHAAQQDADRAAVREALARPDVREVASKMGVDLERMTASVETLGGSDLAQAATFAGQVNQQYVGGASTIVISTTTVIIILLIVLLIVVVAD